MVQNRLELQQTQKLSQSLQTAIHLLSLDLDGLSDYMQKLIQENPALEYLPPQKSAQDYALLVRTRYHSGQSDYRGELPAAAETTLEGLEQQLRLASFPPDVTAAALHLLHLLSPRGYFTQQTEEFARDAGIPLATAQRALEAVQSLEPAGIGARSLEECLSLQLRARADADPLCYDLVRFHLMDIARGNLRRIAKETGATAAHVRQCVETVRGLTPIPCSLSEKTAPYIMPEFSVEADDAGELVIQFHNDYYPTFRQDANFRLLSDTLSGDEQAYARKMLNAAAQLIRAAELRQSTMEKVARFIVSRQRAFFLGQYSLLPLRIDEAAQAIGVHETTVYRAIQNKYLYCSRGTFPLSHFFQRELPGGTSAARAKELIRELCRENPRLSDREIADALEGRGVSLSRRTVNKYRGQMEIDSSFRRKGDVS